MRYLKLEHPDITIRMQTSTKRSDRDGALTTILDLLVWYGVLHDDNIAHCNGRIVLEPVTYSACDETVIELSTR
jgi:hypothetical protein